MLRFFRISYRPFRFEFIGMRLTVLPHPRDLFVAMALVVRSGDRFELVGVLSAPLRLIAAVAQTLPGGVSPGTFRALSWTLWHTRIRRPPLFPPLRLIAAGAQEFGGSESLVALLTQTRPIRWARIGTYRPPVLVAPLRHLVTPSTQRPGDRRSLVALAALRQILGFRRISGAIFAPFPLVTALAQSLYLRRSLRALVAGWK
jgi:hypothetical protein